MKPAKTQVDPNTFVPPAVRRAAAEADAAFRAAHGEQEPAPADAPTDPTPPLQFPAPVPPSPPPTEPSPPVTSQGNYAKAQGDPQPPAEQQLSEESWEHRFKSAEGRFRRNIDDMRAMADQVASMQSMIIALQNRAPVETPPELRPQSLLTPEERSEYGDEFLGVVAKRAKEEFSPEVQALRNKIDGLERRLEGTATQTMARARLDMEASLDQRLPQWRELNFLQDFHTWLALPDTYSGAIRHDLLRAAYEQNNAPRVLAFFRGFLDHEAALAPRANGPDQVTPQGNGKIPLEQFAAPGRAKTAAAQVPAEKPFFTNDQIAKFYAESAAGKWRGREDEYNRIDAAIFEAGREGRIR